MMDGWPFWVRELASWSALMGAAILGRLMFVLRQVQKGHRRFFSVATGIDIMISCPMGVIAYGACVWWGLDGPVAAAVIAVAGYLGPHGIDTLFARWMASKTDKEGH